MKLNVLFDLFYRDLPLAERIARVAATGWPAVETWKGGDPEEMKTLGAACREHGLELVSIVMNGAGDATVAPVRAENRQAFLDRIERYAENALAAGCCRGIVTTGNRVTGRSFYDQKQALIDALAAAGELAARMDFHLNLEPLNDKVDHAGYFLVSREEGIDIVRQAGSPRVRMLYDLYHQQIMTGDHLAFLESHLSWIGHFHAAGVPGRHEVMSGELHLPTVLNRLRNAGYEGNVGLEYSPALDDDRSLRESWEYLSPTLS